jgi:hypothetical protein
MVIESQIQKKRLEIETARIKAEREAAEKKALKEEENENAQAMESERD